MAVGLDVVLTTSLDERFPAKNILDESDQTFWISTGLYPQEIILKVSSEGASIKVLKAVCTNVRSLKVDFTSEPEPVNFQSLCPATNLEKKGGRLQFRDIDLNGENVRYLRVTLLEGWHDFASVHKLQVS
eukprot:GEMP01115912.1.p1 GENE.GEMP01115912.1~~GEMP01115912.1.p1  ORF type:complete len:138 (+),score=16.56 GEMP01115912.1:27-416(+)